MIAPSCLASVEHLILYLSSFLQNRIFRFILSFCLTAFAAMYAHGQSFVRSSVFAPLPEENERSFLDNHRDSVPSLLSDDLSIGKPSRFDAEVSRSLHSSLTEFYRNHLSLAIFQLRQAQTHIPEGSVRRDESHLLSALEILSRSTLTDADVKIAIADLDAISESAFMQQPSLRSEYLFWRAETERMTSRSSLAHEHYSEAISISENETFTSLIRFRKAELFEKKGQFIEALSYFDTVARNTNVSPLALQASLNRASILSVLGKPEEAVAELSRSQSILAGAEQIFILDKRFHYGSLTESYLRSADHHSDSLTRGPQLSSPYTPAVIEFLIGSQLTELGKYGSAIATFTRAENEILQTRDSNGYANESKHLLDAIRFERSWAQLASGGNTEAASGFRALALSDSAHEASAVGGSLRDAGRHGDLFYEEPTEYRSQRDTSSAERFDYSTAPFYYSDYPARAKYYEGIALSRMGKADEARNILTALAQDGSRLYSDKARYHLALVEARTGKMFQAEALLAPLGLRRTPSGVYASLLLGDIHYRRNSFARAAEYFGFALENLPQSDTSLRLMAQLERGLSLIPLGSWNEASKELKQYVAHASMNAPGREEALYWLGRSYLRIDSAALARDQFKAILNEYPKSDRGIDAQYGYAWTLFRNGEYLAVDREFKKVLEMDSITRYAYDALSRRGDAMYANGEMQKALKIYNLAVDRPTFNKYLTTRAMFQLGLARMRSDSSRSAMNAFNHIITKYPQSDILDRAYFNYAVAAFAILQTDKAEEAVNALSTKFPDSPLAPKALYLSASEAERNLRLEKALAIYKKIIKAYPTTQEYEASLFGTLDILDDNKRFVEAIALCDSQMLRTPALRPRLLIRKGELQMYANHPTDAITTFELFAEKYPADILRPRSEFLFGKALAASGKTDSALAKYHDIVRIYTNSDASSFALLELARNEKKNERSRKAAEYYTQAFSLDRFSSDAAPTAMYEYAGFLRTTLNDPDSALHIYDELTRRYLIDTRVGSMAQHEAAEILLDQGKQTAAITRLEKIATAHVGEMLAAETHLDIAAIYRKSSGSKKALEEYDAARSQRDCTNDQYARSMLGSAEMLIALGAKAKAKSLLREIAEDRSYSRLHREKAGALIEQLSPKKKKKGKHT